VWVLSAATSGIRWTTAFLDHARSLSTIDAHEGSSNVSLVGTARHLVDDPVPGWVAAGLVALGVVALARRAHLAGRPELTAAAVAVGTVLCVPHVIFYDAGIALLAVLVIVDRHPRIAPIVAVAGPAATWLGAWQGAPVNALCLATLAVLGVLLRTELGPELRAGRRVPVLTGPHVAR
jgi:hypothetical protein